MESMKRRQPSTQFKAQVALDALKGPSTVNEWASRSGVHPAQITRWKPRLEAGVDEMFSRGQHQRARAAAALRARRYQEIGQLKVALAWVNSQSSPL